MTRGLSQARLDPGAPRFLPLSSVVLSLLQANCSPSPRLPEAPGSQQPQAPFLLVTLHGIPEARMKTGLGIWKLEQKDQDFKTNLNNLVPDSKQEK